MNSWLITRKATLETNNFKAKGLNKKQIISNQIIPLYD